MSASAADKRRQKMKKENERTIVWSLALFMTAAVWGFAFVVVKDSLDDVPVLYMMAIRFTIAAVVHSFAFYRKLGCIKKNTLKEGVILGIMLFLAYTFQTYGCKYTTAGKNAFITSVYVILVPFLNFAIFRKHLSKFNIISGFMAFAGIAMISLSGSDGGINIGDVLTMICGICYAVQIIYIDRFTEEEDPALLNLIQMAVVAVLSWIAAPFAEGSITNAVTVNPSMLMGMAYLGFLSTAVCFLLQMEGQKRLHPSTASLIMSFEAVFGILSSVIFLGEKMNIRIVTGCGLMFAAIMVAETLGDKKNT